MVHIGQIIKQEMERQERAPAWLARKIHCQRPNIYYIYSQPSINTDLLILISKALGVDFFKVISDSIDVG
ncbi:MAG: XRE family transcriptional regulator [Paramuribaculum sp.]|nr:XRE family transcriptional regulator [Paramuribaculum sp.]